MCLFCHHLHLCSHFLLLLCNICHISNQINVRNVSLYERCLSAGMMGGTLSSQVFGYTRKWNKSRNDLLTVVQTLMWTQFIKTVLRIYWEHSQYWIEATEDSRNVYLKSDMSVTWGTFMRSTTLLQVKLTFVNLKGMTDFFLNQHIVFKNICIN